MSTLIQAFCLGMIIEAIIITAFSMWKDKHHGQS